MTLRLLRPAILVAGCVMALPLCGQDDPKPADGKDRATAEPSLPPGATLRLGTGLPVRFTPGFTLRPPEYKTVLTPDIQGNLHLLDVATGRARGKPAGATVGQVVLSADGKHFIIARTGKLAVRDVETGKTIAEIDPLPGFSTGFVATAPSASLSGDATRAAQGGQSMNGMGLAVVHEVATKEILFQAPMQYAGPVIPLLSSDGRYLATRRYQTVLRSDMKDDPKLTHSAQVWDVDAGKELFTATVMGGGIIVNAMAFSPDGKTLAVSCGEGPIDLWEVPGGKHRVTILGRTRQGMRLAFSADGKTLAALSRAGVIQRWNAADGKFLDSTEWPGEVALNTALGLAFAGDSRLVAWGSSGSAPVVWEAPSGKVLSPVPEQTGAIRGIAFAPGGKEIITASHDGRIIRWDAATGKPRGRIALNFPRGPSAGARAILALAPDGSRAITYGFPSAIYELPSGNELFGLPGGAGVPMNRSIFPAHDLATAITIHIPVDRKLPGTAMVLDLKSARKLGEVEMDPGRTAALAAVVTPEGSRLVVAANTLPEPRVPAKMTIAAWNLKTGKKLSQVEDAPGTNQVQLAAVDENTVLVSDSSGKLRRLEIGRGAFGEDLEPIVTGYAAPGPIVFNPDRTRFAVGVSTGEAGAFGVRIHEWPSGKVLHTFKGHPSQITALTFSVDGKQLASGSSDASVLVWDLGAIKPKE